MKEKCTWEIVDSFWNALLDSYNNCRNGREYGETLHFNHDQYDTYKDIFKKSYEDILTHYMTSDTERLDAHKVAAISIFAAIGAKVVTQDSTENYLSFGSYIVALETALSYLSHEINKRVKEIHPQKGSVQLASPSPFICDTEYFEVMTRLLYYETHALNYGTFPSINYNIFEWSDRFFLLEYITYLESGISPESMKEKK